MIKSQSSAKLYWDSIIIIFSVYQAVSIPIELSFEPDYVDNIIVTTFDSIVNLFFVADIFVRVRTTHIHPVSGEEVIDAYKNAEHYLFSLNFVFDLLSTIPWDVVAPHNKELLYLGLLKILRVFRISSVISDLNNTQEFKSLAKIVMLSAFMLIYINLMGSIWNIVVDLEEIWIPNKDFVWIGTPQIYEYYTMSW